MDAKALWEKFQAGLFFDPVTQFSLDISRMDYEVGFLKRLSPQMKEAFQQMSSLEAGEISNPDEKRMVGHYWLRSPDLAPNPEIGTAIKSTISSIEEFTKEIHAGSIRGSTGKQFRYLLVIGIGGSALGPQFVSDALATPENKLKIFFFDNTDPDGFHKVLSFIPDLSEALGVVISKSGGTKETRNGQLIFKEALTQAGLAPSKHLVAVTGEGSELDQTAKNEEWVARFPMWDWIGGRTSELSAVGLLPAALEGYNIRELLAGAQSMDSLTRNTEVSQNPAALLASMWFHAGAGKGLKDMVVLPYKDRLLLLSRYLQQLVMESLGKEKNLQGQQVNQGIAVYGNKGSTDQHAYVQQLREGLNNFFAVFIHVLKEQAPSNISSQFSPAEYEVEPGVTSGDYLNGFLLGTRKALYENGRESVTITVREVSEFTVGQLIALFERAVGLYASLIQVNAYHQPGVEAGKKAATEMLALQKEIMQFLSTNPGYHTAQSISEGLGREQEVEAIFHISRHLAANSRLRCQERMPLVESQYSARY